VAAIRLPRISNSTDVEALACEPGVVVRWVADVADLADADAVVLPGSKATVADLAWLRDRGLADGVLAHAASGRAVVGVCGGFQMLCRVVDDPVESGRGRVDGLGLLDAAAAAGRHGFVVADDVDVAGRRDAQLDAMADLLAEHLDCDAVLELVAGGAPPRPVITSHLYDG